MGPKGVSRAVAKAVTGGWNSGWEAMSGGYKAVEGRVGADGSTSIRFRANRHRTHYLTEAGFWGLENWGIWGKWGEMGENEGKWGKLGGNGPAGVVLWSVGWE